MRSGTAAAEAAPVMRPPSRRSCASGAARSEVPPSSRSIESSSTGSRATPDHRAAGARRHERRVSSGATPIQPRYSLRAGFRWNGWNQPDSSPTLTRTNETDRTSPDGTVVPLKVETRVRIPYGLQRSRRSGAVSTSEVAPLAPSCQSLANPSRERRWWVAGFMRQRGDAWELRVYVGRNPVDGKKQWANRTVRGGKREAQRALAAMVAEAARGGLATPGATSSTHEPTSRPRRCWRRGASWIATCCRRSAR
jgi:hypothetical protein